MDFRKPLFAFLTVLLILSGIGGDVFAKTTKSSSCSVEFISDVGSSSVVVVCDGSESAHQDHHCADVCHFGLSHFGHCSFPHLSSKVQYLIFPAFKPSPAVGTKDFDDPVIEGPKKPPRFV